MFSKYTKDGKITNWGRLLAFLKNTLVNSLKKEAVKIALRKLLGSATAAGFYGWIITYVVEELYERAAEPLIEGLFRKLGYRHEKIKGKSIYVKVQDAEDIDAWRDAINNI